MKSNTRLYGLTRRLRQSLSLGAALALCSPALAQDVENQPASLLAYWNFNDASNPNQSVATVGGWVGTFTNLYVTNANPTFSADGEGSTGQAGDRALDMGEQNVLTNIVDGVTNTWQPRPYVSVTDILPTLNEALGKDKFAITIRQKWSLPIKENATMYWSSGGTRTVQSHAPWVNNSFYFDAQGRLSGAVPAVTNWGEWHSIIYTKYGLETRAVMIDGVPALANTPNAPMAQNIDEVRIGGGAANQQSFTGLLDDYAIWIGVLTTNQLAKLNSGMTPDQVAADTDGDGMSDDYEDYWGFDKNNPADGPTDFDVDGLSNYAESTKGTNPKNDDSDNDGYKDGVETDTGTFVSTTDTGTSPLNPDCDGDGLLDGVETGTFFYVSPTDTGTSPLAVDSDYDGFPDGTEVALNTNPSDYSSWPNLGDGLRLLAYWDFNTNTVATQAVDQIYGSVADFPPGLDGTNVTSGVVYTDGGLGYTTNANDRAADFGTNAFMRTILSTDVAPYLQAASVIQDPNGYVGGNISVSFWQKWSTPTAQSSSFWMVSPTANANRAMQAHVPFGGTTVYFDFADAAGNNRVQGEPPFGWDFQQWHHYAFVKNADTMYVYMDGALILTGTSTKALVSDISELYLGARGTDLAQIQGLLDDVAIYGIALTTSQVQALAFGYAPTQIDQVDGDADGDGMPDIYEFQYSFLNPNNSADAGLDQDNDLSTNLEEYQRNTDIENPDTDDDGLRDGVETDTAVWVSATDTGTDPLNPDSDGDSLKDGVETNTGNYVNADNTGTSPLGLDYDGDLYGDGLEVAFGTNPTDAASIPVVTGIANILAYWDFNDASVPTESTDLIYGWVGALTGEAAYTADGGGFSGQAGDRAVDLGTNGTSSVRNSMGQWLNIAGVTNSITISLWEKWAVAPQNQSVVWGLSPSAGRGFSSHAPWSNNNIYWDVSGTANRVNDPATGVVWENQWHHLALVKSNTTMEIWLDGNLFDFRTDANAAMVTDMTDFIMGNSNVGTEGFRGQIDDIAVYASALDPTNIVALSLGASPLDFVAPEQPPVLSIERLGDDLVLSWSETGFTVQTNADVAIPAGWGDVPGATNSPWTNALPADGSGYFRLTK